MEHLPSFWNPSNWDDKAWEVYLERRRGWWKRFKNRLDQWHHRRLGRKALGSLDPDFEVGRWEAREFLQWPSATGSYDPCEDHYNFLLGYGDLRGARSLRLNAKLRRPEFL
jgi:hypothetical protein